MTTPVVSQLSSWEIVHDAPPDIPSAPATTTHTHTQTARHFNLLAPFTVILRDRSWRATRHSKCSSNNYTHRQTARHFNLLAPFTAALWQNQLSVMRKSQSQVFNAKSQIFNTYKLHKRKCSCRSNAVFTGRQLQWMPLITGPEQWTRYTKPSVSVVVLTCKMTTCPQRWKLGLTVYK